jgi:hypothetical protein
MTAYNRATTNPPMNWLVDSAPVIRFCSSAEPIPSLRISRCHPAIVGIPDAPRRAMGQSRQANLRGKQMHEPTPRDVPPTRSSD